MLSTENLAIPARLATCAVVGLVMLSPQAPCAADEVSPFDAEFAVRGVAHFGKYNNALEDDGRHVDDSTQGATIADLAVTFSPTARDRFYTQVRWASANALNNRGDFFYAAYGGDLEDQVENVAGRDRDYLREAWYRRDIAAGESGSLALTAGLIDATNYLALNAYFGDEDQQFMNQLLSNNQSVQLPSYDVGGVVEYSAGQWTATAVFMRPKTPFGKDYKYYAAQIGFRHESGLGVGNVRVLSTLTNDRFRNADNTDDDARIQAIGCSIDQEIGPSLGLFLELGIQDDEAAIEFDKTLMTGLNVAGGTWGRQNDEIGIAYAYASGADNAPRDSVNMLETYYRLQLTDSTDIGMTLQYQREELQSADDDQERFIIALRFNSVLSIF